MSALPVTLFLTATVGLGLYLLTLYLRGVRKPGLVSVHLLLGAAGLVQLMMLQRGAPNGELAAGGRFGPLAGGLFALSLISGLVTPLLARQRQTSVNTMLTIHVAVGLGGFLMFLSWLATL